jgi:hydroxyacylglutathione hydrolase
MPAGQEGERVPANVETLNLGFVNAYLLRSREGFILVDTGLPGRWDALHGRLTAAGCSPGLLKLVVLTHADLDHSGNCARLRESYAVPIAAHPLESAALGSGVSPKRTIRSASGKILFGLFRIFRRIGRGPTGFRPIKPDVLLQDGQSLDGYGLAARVIHLPGHTRGSIALLTEEGELIAGDFYTNRKKPGVSPYVESFEEYRRILEKVKQLAGAIKTVYPGHGTQFSADRLSALSL